MAVGGLRINSSSVEALMIAMSAAAMNFALALKSPSLPSPACGGG